MAFDLDALFNAHSLQRSMRSDDQCRLVHLIKSLSSYDGWKLCISLLADNNSSLPSIRCFPPEQKTATVFICCRALEDFLKCSPLTQGEVNDFSSFFWAWSKLLIQPTDGQNVDRIVELKASQLACLAVLRYYPKLWPSFFHDLLSFMGEILKTESSDAYATESSLRIATDLFADIFANLDPHLVSRDVQLTTEELARGNEIKDNMRPVVIPQLIKFIYDVLRHLSSDMKCTVQLKKLLTVLGLLASWVDLQLVGDKSWIEFVAGLMEASFQASMGEVVRSGIYCYLLGLVTKGMSPVDKFTLINGIWDRLRQLLLSDPLVTGLSSCTTLDCSEAQLDCIHNFSLLIDAVGVQLVNTLRSLHSLECNGDKTNGNAEQMSPELVSLRPLVIDSIENKLDIALFLFSNGDEQVSRAILPFLRGYISLVKSSTGSTSVDGGQNTNRRSHNQNSSTSMDSPSSLGGAVNGLPPSNTGLIELTQPRLEHLKRLLFILINQWRTLHIEQCDGSLGINENDDADDTEEDADAYRHDLRIAVCNLIQLDASFVLEIIKQLVVNAAHILTTHSAIGSTATLTQEQCADIDVALGLYYLFGEACKAQKNDHFSNEFPLRQMMLDIMGYLCSDAFSRQPRSTLQLQFFEVMARYERYFLYAPDHLLGVMLAFVDSRGLHSHWRPVRVRCAYLMTRLVKSHRKTLAPHTEQLLTNFADLLSLPSEPEGVEISHQSADHRGKLNRQTKQAALLGVTEQSFLYEIAAQLIAVGGGAGSFTSINTGDDKMGELFRMLLSPVLAQYGQLVDKLVTEADPKMAAARGNLVKQAADLVTRTCRVFSQPKSVLSAGCHSVLCEALHILVTSLNRLPQDVTFTGRTAVCAGIRAFLHRMVVCLGPNSPDAFSISNGADDNVLTVLLAALSQAVPQLIRAARADLSAGGGVDLEQRLRELRDVIPLINQVVLRYRVHCANFLLDCLPELLATCLSTLTGPVSPDDAQQLCVIEEHKLLRRGMLQMLQTIAQHLPDLLLQFIGSVENLIALLTQTQACIESDDAVGLRAGIGAFYHLVQSKCQDEQFYQAFLLPHLVPFCVLAPSRPQFRLADAQFNFSLGDMASCLYQLAQHQTQFVVFLQDYFLPQQQLSPDLIHSYVAAIQSPTVKEFQNFIRSFYAAFR